MASAGNIALYLALLSTAYAIITTIIGLKNKQVNYLTSSRGATLASFLLVAIASLVLLQALLTSNFYFAYVSNYTNLNLPVIYKVSAFWAGQAGSLLLWLLILSGLTLVLQYVKAYQEEHVGLKVTCMINLVRLFFIFLLINPCSPFKTLSFAPFDGNGLNPMLQSFGMVIHPPILFLGYSGFIVPFALVVVDLLFTKKNPSWAERVRPWVLASWLLLSAGIITGGNWAYTQLGWGGYWAWDPVENASLLPWLTSTALLHTLIIQRQKNVMKLWNYLLIACTFLLTIFATFLTRSGFLDSIHAFGEDKLGTYFLVLLIFFSLFTVFLLIVCYPELKSTWPEIRALSKESGILLASVLLLLIFFEVLFGTLFPLVSRVFFPREIVLDQIFYNQVTTPLWLVLSVLIGLSSVLCWNRTEISHLKLRLCFPMLICLLTVGGLYIGGVHKFTAIISFAITAFGCVAMLQDYFLGVWNYKKVQHKSFLAALQSFFLLHKKGSGAYLAHIGVIVIFIGITGGIFTQEKIQTLKPGEILQIGKYHLEFQGLIPREEKGYTYIAATLKVFRAKKLIGTVTSEKIFHSTYLKPATTVGILSTLKDDIYFNLAGWEGDLTQVQVSLHPLIIWIWIGSYLVFLGVGVVLWPEKKLKI